MTYNNSNVHLWALKAMSALEEVRKRATAKLFKNVVLDTPVISGQLRGGWHPTVNSPSTEAGVRLDPGGQNVLNEIEAVVAASKPEDKLILTNNQLYGPKIEFDGENNPHWQRPEGMVRVNVARWQAIVAEENAKVRT